MHNVQCVHVIPVCVRPPALQVGMVCAAHSLAIVVYCVNIGCFLCQQLDHLHTSLNGSNVEGVGPKLQVERDHMVEIQCSDWVKNPRKQSDC